MTVEQQQKLVAIIANVAPISEYKIGRQLYANGFEFEVCRNQEQRRGWLHSEDEQAWSYFKGMLEEGRGAEACAVAYKPFSDDFSDVDMAENREGWVGV